MIEMKSWGFEDEVFPNGRRVFMNEQFCTDLHRHESDENLLLDSGLLFIEVGETPYSLGGSFFEDNSKLTIKSGQWHRITSLKDSVLFDFSVRVGSVLSSGGKLSDEQFRGYLSTYTKTQDQDRILTPERAGAIASAYRGMGRKIGFCNGCFDLMHLGHVELLRQAKARCEILFVGVNNDLSVKALKGEGRPFVDELGRLGMVESCRFVDYVVEIFDKTCISSVSAIKPDIYVTTSEYGTSGPEAKLVLHQGGSVEVVDMVTGYNTTKLAMSIAGRRGK